MLDFLFTYDTAVQKKVKSLEEKNAIMHVCPPFPPVSTLLNLFKEKINQKNFGREKTDSSKG